MVQFNPEPPVRIMHILLLEIDIHIPDAHSLKEKRSVLKRLLNEIRRDFNVSAAEIDYHDQWQDSGLAFVAVGNLKPALERIERQLVDLIDARHDVELGAVRMEWL